MTPNDLDLKMILQVADVVQNLKVYLNFLWPLL